MWQKISDEFAMMYVQIGCYNKSCSPVGDLLEEVIRALFIAAVAAGDDNEFSCFYIVLHGCSSERHVMLYFYRAMH